MSWVSKLSTYWTLGPVNIIRVAVYRLGLKSGWHQVQRVKASVARPPFFRVSERENDPPAAEGFWGSSMYWFGAHRSTMPDDPPDWFENPFSSSRQPNENADWWLIPDFGAGDIKGLWELSRFNWAVAWSTKIANGDSFALEKLNSWLADWVYRNPPYKGPNWKCGQEASIRVMHLVTVALVLGQDRRPEQGLVDLLIVHLRRIAPTVPYAIGQQNNHGTSEAAALFLGGTFLAGHYAEADLWATNGRRLLEERAMTLIEPDGSFSQYSVNYHRMMLDTYSLAELWRRRTSLVEFSTQFEERLAAATNWLWAITDEVTGDAPNIGGNDGAHLLALSGSDYRDFRPSVQLAAALFCGADAFGAGPWNRQLQWYGVSAGNPRAAPNSQSFDHGGYHVLRTGSNLAVLRYPRFRFRPSQADALHLDLWTNGVNLLRDAGTFSYNSPGAEWFSSTAAHNTISFDKRNQMPSLGRFLFGDWLKSENVELVRLQSDAVIAAASYKDSIGAYHHREVVLTSQSLVCRDVISGNFRVACLRWRLAPGNWGFKENSVQLGSWSILIEIDGKPVTPTLGTTLESRYYQAKVDIPEISVEVNREATISTKIIF